MYLISLSTRLSTYALFAASPSQVGVAIPVIVPPDASKVAPLSSDTSPSKIVCVLQVNSSVNPSKAVLRPLAHVPPLVSPSVPVIFMLFWSALPSKVEAVEVLARSVVRLLAVLSLDAAFAIPLVK